MNKKSKYKQLDDDLRVKIDRWYSRGVKIMEIARRLEVPYWTIRNHLYGKRRYDIKEISEETLKAVIVELHKYGDLRKAAKKYKINQFKLGAVIENYTGMTPVEIIKSKKTGVYRKYNPLDPRSIACQQIESCSGQGCYLAQRCPAHTNYLAKREYGNKEIRIREAG